MREVEAAADSASSGDKKSRNQAISMVVPLCLAHAREQAEVGGVFNCVLLPLSYITAVVTLEKGEEGVVKELQEVKAHLEKSWQKRKEDKKGMQKTEDEDVFGSEEEEGEDEEEEDEEEEPVVEGGPAEPPAPHIHFALGAIAATFSQGCKDEN